MSAYNEHLIQQEINIGNGMIVGATIITESSSTKNNDKEGNPEMHQPKKGTQWDFGIKGYIGIDSQVKLIHSIKVGQHHQLSDRWECMIVVAHLFALNNPTFPKVRIKNRFPVSLRRSSRQTLQVDGCFFRVRYMLTKNLRSSYQKLVPPVGRLVRADVKLPPQLDQCFLAFDRG